MQMWKELLIAMLAVVSIGGNAIGGLIGYWNFNDNTPIGDLLTLNGGTGAVLTASGTYTSQSGSTINRILPDVAGQAFAYEGSAGLANNGATLTAQFSMINQINPVVSFAGQRSNTGFNSIDVSTSTDGVTFASFAVLNLPSLFSLQTVDLSSVNSLDNAAVAFVRFTFTGATNASGNARIDNLQINAASVPEPTSMLLVATSAAFGLFARHRSRRRSNASFTGG
jgi:hypothetical protein